MPHRRGFFDERRGTAPVVKLLLDTHVFLWSLIDTAKLSANARAALHNPANDIIVSAVNFWEIAIKFALGKLDLHGVRPEGLPAEARIAGYRIVGLEPDVAASSYRLPREIQRDPFDRMLAWQSMCAEWTLVSRDRLMAGYEPHGLKLLW